MAVAPAIFFGHGSPMTTLTKNRYTDAWHAMGGSFAHPKAILCISAHWFISSSAVLVTTAPETIHDFGGFPKALYDIRYPAPGSPELARTVQKLLAPLPVDLSEKWGLDHGTWTVLRHVFPRADVPVVQLSIDGTKGPQYHYEIGKRLAVLRSEGVLIVGSGNVVHNLRQFVRDQPQFQPYDWAVKFDARVREHLKAKTYAPLVEYYKLGPEAMLSVPTPDHYFPLLYVLGTAHAGEAVKFPVEGIDGGSMSMLAVQIG